MRRTVMLHMLVLLNYDYDAEHETLVQNYEINRLLNMVLSKKQMFKTRRLIAFEYGAEPKTEVQN